MSCFRGIVLDEMLCIVLPEGLTNFHASQWKPTPILFAPFFIRM